MARLSEHGIRLSSMSPSFLNSNSTSHTWPFSAVAELIDNASDPGVSAKQIWIDVVKEGDDLCLTFTDNGSGMTPNKLHKMLSFGFTDKGSGKASQQAIGVYGNGFKSGSMRLGRDALIFTKNGGCQSVGLLSQTYLKNIKAQAVIVPIVPFSQQTKSLVVTEDSEASLAAILQHSIINSVEHIHQHFDSILSKKGTKILIWNLRRAKDEKSEIDFETDESDFRLPEIQIDQLKRDLRTGGSFKAEKNIPDMQYSLRAYLSILYLKPRTQVILRGKKVQAKLVSKRLIHIEHDVYKPHFSKEKVKVTFGLNPKNKQHYGIMMYHKNRLIKAYEKVGWQLKTAGQRAGMGVIGIIECNFLKPAHNKQDFEFTKEYRLTLGALGQKLNDYWKEMTEKKAKEREFWAADTDCTDEGPMWLQCEDCLKWRSVPRDHYKVAPESWNCSQNPNPRLRCCSSPEEAEDSEELLTPSYQKNHKKQEHHNSRKQDKILEVCEPQKQSWSEAVQPVVQSMFTVESIAKQCHTEKNTPENSETNTDYLSEHDTDVDADAQKNDNAKTQRTVTLITQTQEKGKREVSQWRTDSETNAQGLKDGKRNIDTDVQTTERKTEHADGLRKSVSPFYCKIKKRHLLGKRHFDAENQAQKSQTRTETFKTSSSDRNNTGCSDRVENPDTANQASSVHTWSHPLSSTQTVMVSPLSRTEGQKVSLEGGNKGAKVQRLAALEKEVQKLKSHLDLEIGKTSQGTMTVADSSGETPKRGLVSTSTASRDVGCQTNAAQFLQSCSSFTGPAQAAGPPGAVVLGQRVIFDPKEQSGQNIVRGEKPDSESKSRVSDSEAYEDSRSVQENLQDIRNNVVVLLTALLPQLDLAGISLETTDVDNILQQIIEVNSLKL